MTEEVVISRPFSAGTVFGQAGIRNTGSVENLWPEYMARGRSGREEFWRNVGFVGSLLALAVEFSDTDEGAKFIFARLSLSRPVEIDDDPYKKVRQHDFLVKQKTLDERFGEVVRSYSPFVFLALAGCFLPLLLRILEWTGEEPWSLDDWRYVVPWVSGAFGAIALLVWLFSILQYQKNWYSYRERDQRQAFHAALNAIETETDKPGHAVAGDGG